jgi:hypothetical protein
LRTDCEVVLRRVPRFDYYRRQYIRWGRDGEPAGRLTGWSCWNNTVTGWDDHDGG